MDSTESDRQYETIDLMLNSHALLRDKYKFRALLLNIGILLASVFICALVFVDAQLFNQIGIPSQKAKFFIGVFSIICFALSLIEYRIDLKGQASLHSDAANRLASLKIEYRDSYSKFKGASETENQKLTDKYNETMDRIVSIPESMFIKLKSSYHHKKIVSKLINEFPSTPVFILSMKSRFKDITKLINSNTLD